MDIGPFNFCFLHIHIQIVWAPDKIMDIEDKGRDEQGTKQDTPKCEANALLS